MDLRSAAVAGIFILVRDILWTGPVSLDPRAKPQVKSHRQGGMAIQIIVYMGFLAIVDYCHHNHFFIPLFSFFYCYGYHNLPLDKEGVLMVKPKLVMVGVTIFKIKVIGKGGHGSVPHLRLNNQKFI